MPSFLPGAPTVLEWIQECALDDLESLQYALTKKYFTISDDEGTIVCVFGSSEGAQSHPLFGRKPPPEGIYRYQEWRGPKEEFLWKPFVEGMWDHEKWEPGETLLPDNIKMERRVEDMLEKRREARGDDL